MELVDTRDLKSLAPLGMRVRVPPVLPSVGHREYYDELRKFFGLDSSLEVYVYNSKAEIVNINSLWIKMNTRDMWENQVELLTRQCQSLTRQIDELEQRLHYFEGVVVTLLVALKEGGVIVDDAASTETTSYEFD